MRLRSKGMSITTGSNWLFNIVVSFITPVVLAKTTSGLYFAFGVCCIIMAIVCFFIPETNGKTLEEMEIVFGGGYHFLFLSSRGLELLDVLILKK